MSALFRVSIVGASLTSAIALSDAVYHGFTGRNIGPASEPAATWAIVVGSLISGFTYAVLAGVLITASAHVDRGSRIRRWLRWLLAGCFSAMAAVFTVGSPVLASAGGRIRRPCWVCPAAGAFVGMFLPLDWAGCGDDPSPGVAPEFGAADSGRPDTPGDHWSGCPRQRLRASGVRRGAGQLRCCPARLPPRGGKRRNVGGERR